MSFKTEYPEVYKTVMFNKFGSREFTEITKDGKTDVYNKYVPFPRSNEF